VRLRMGGVEGGGLGRRKELTKQKPLVEASQIRFHYVVGGSSLLAAALLAAWFGFCVVGQASDSGFWPDYR